jgi:hypothetical protein
MGPQPPMPNNGFPAPQPAPSLEARFGTIKAPRLTDGTATPAAPSESWHCFMPLRYFERGCLDVPC